MIHLYEKKHYTWSLFIGHLVIEKLLKALYTQKFSNNPPYTHDLYRLSKRKRSRGFFLCVLCGLYGEKSSPPRRRWVREGVAEKIILSFAPEAGQTINSLRSAQTEALFSSCATPRRSCQSPSQGQEPFLLCGTHRKAKKLNLCEPSAFSAPLRCTILTPEWLRQTNAALRLPKTKKMILTQ
jgi:hypothetical protein